MKIIFASPSPDDLIRLLKAWRFWLLGALVGALIGAVIFYTVPPPYRARATVNVDFHLEQAWPQNTDREQFYYLERETRKLEEIAVSDAVLNSVAAQVSGVTVQQLRDQKLQLSQPGNGGWHFFADDHDPQRAGGLASVWAQAFAQNVQTQITNPSGGLEQYITATPTQVQDLTARRSISLSYYLLVGAIVFLALFVFVLLFIDFKR
jgi:capsular polysaccharide biosynthesis protein